MNQRLAPQLDLFRPIVAIDPSIVALCSCGLSEQNRIHSPRKGGPYHAFDGETYAERFDRQNPQVMELLARLTRRAKARTGCRMLASEWCGSFAVGSRREIAENNVVQLQRRGRVEAPSRASRQSSDTGAGALRSVAAPARASTTTDNTEPAETGDQPTSLRVRRNYVH